MNVGQADTFGSLCAVIQDHSENAAVKETGIRQANKADDGSALRRIASTADAFDALTHHNNNGVHVVGLGDFNAAGRFGGGFLDAGFLFRLNLVFSTEDRVEAVGRLRPIVRYPLYAVFLVGMVLLIPKHASAPFIYFQF